MSSVNEFIEFDSGKGSKQKLPKERKLVIVRMNVEKNGYPDGFGVGYLRYGGGDKNSPYFVVQGIHTGKEVAWCDCLPEGFKLPPLNSV